jgi:hypothetical protein
MFWTGTEDEGGYGMMDKHGAPRPAFHAKRLCAQYIRYGDWIRFPTWDQGNPPVDAVVARGEHGRRSALLVHRAARRTAYALPELDGSLAECRMLLKIDEGTGNQVMKGACNGTVTFDGYGVAVVTNVVTETDAAGRVIGP